MGLKLSSNSFNDGYYLSDKQTLGSEFGFGCDGNNLSPELHLEGIPEETKSLALTCYDPDAPTGSGFWHWVVVNIPPDIASIPEAANSLLSEALETRTDFGELGYGAPCPPQGDHPHRYIFTLHCLSEDSLPVETDTSAAVVGFIINANTLEKPILMGLYNRYSFQENIA